jgi:UDP-N-acetylmuramoyl-L-alanyl-D-glutamate--2,6-diaminopimelate ligase
VSAGGGPRNGSGGSGGGLPAPSWAAVVDAVERHAWDGGPLAGVTDDSRQVRPGAVFVARAGFRTDGHAFVAEAASRGAAFVVSEREVDSPLPVCRVPDGRRAISTLADAWYGHPSRHLRLVGITGTNGKTTAAWLTASVLRAAGLSTTVVGTAGLASGARPTAHLPWTTPPPVELHGLLASAVVHGQAAAVLEVSAQALSQGRVADCAFDAAALTNLSLEHGEYYADAAAYAEAKAELFRLLGGRNKPARGILPADLPAADLFRRACRVPRIEYGPGAAVDAISARPAGLSGTDLVLRLPGDGHGGGSPATVALRLRLPGRHNVENALCAAALGCALSIAPEVVAQGLAALRQVPGRLRHVRRRPVRVVVDYAHNPAGLRAVLGLLRSATPGRLVLVMGARGGRDTGKRPLMGAVAASFCDRILLTSDRPAGEDPAEAAEPMRAAAAAIGVPVELEVDRLRALERGLRDLRPGDCLVALGKGEEPWDADDAAGGEGLDDMVALRRLLAKRGAAAKISGAQPAPETEAAGVNA